MSRATLILGHSTRSRALAWIGQAPDGAVLEIREPKRSNDQNALLWALLGEVAVQVRWHGLKLSPADWKDIFTASLRKELRTVPNLEGNGFVVLGMRTSEMTKGEFSQLVELILAFGAEQGVTFKTEAKAA